MSQAAPIRESTLVKGLPCNPEAERAILGAALLDNAVLPQAAGRLKAEDFFFDSNRRLFQRIVWLAESSRPIDLVTLCEELMRNGELEAVGGASYISSLTDGLPRLSNIEHYVGIVKDKSIRRRLVHISNGIVGRCLEGSEETAEILDLAQAEVLALGPVDFEEWLQDGIPTEKQMKSERAMDYIRHGSPRIDQIIIGGESGPKARPFDLQWARGAISKCKAAGVPVFLKQLGSKPFRYAGQHGHLDLHLTDRKGGNMNEWPEDLKIREFPDGKT